MRAGLRYLECRVPPPLVALLCAALLCWPPAAWAMALPSWPAWLLLAAGLSLEGHAVLAFRRRRTTINPLTPARSSALVCDGLYRYSRNPMYLGMLCLLLALAWWRQQWPLAPLLFVLWMNVLQIAPEERALRARFGAAYDDYCRRVRRWC